MSRKYRENLIWGLILVIIGAIFLLENIGYDAWRAVFKLWPLILIFWGASKLYYGIKTRSQAEKSETTEAEVEILPGDKKDES
ncbi:MAG: LiaF transmembrane domain-containing protein [Candidatus Saccharicenans sp.]|uniref:LiaF transmembrane domain-containing protein n=1 Tax=Candidatus Saccharicenans sp. TaxID=2819258 RepID=UPI00404B8ED4